MVKKDQQQKEHKKKKHVSDDEASSPEEEAPPKKIEKQKHPENDDKSNKFKMGSFHRIANSKKKRVSSSKKKIRDLKRLIEKQGIPEEIKAAKKKDLKELKRGERKKKEAEKFELKYKKIKFFEKKKIIKKLGEIEKKMKDAESSKDENALKELSEEKQKYKNYLVYVNNFPANKKYIALFPNADTEESIAARQLMLDKLIKFAEVKNKIREKELLELEEEQDDEQEFISKVKEIETKDNFFAKDDKDEVQKPIQKKIVQRNGMVLTPYVPKPPMQQRPPRQQQMPQRQYEQVQPQKVVEVEQQKPDEPLKPQVIKINPNSYRQKGFRDSSHTVQAHIKL